MKPSGQILDGRQRSITMQLALDSALEGALLEMDAGKALTPEKSHGNADGRIEMQLKSHKVEELANVMTVVINAKSSKMTPPMASELQVNVIKKEGRWRAFAYDIQPSPSVP